MQLIGSGRARSAGLRRAGALAYRKRKAALKARLFLSRQRQTYLAGRPQAGCLPSREDAPYRCLERGVMKGRFLVLRPQPGADETAAALRDAGIDALPLPVLGRKPLPETPAMRASIQALAEHRLVIFVSPAAVEIGMALIDRYWPQYPVTVHWIAVGERTRQALADWGVEALAPAADDEHSEGLLALQPLNEVAGERVLIMRGRGGREALSDALRERGARV